MKYFRLATYLVLLAVVLQLTDGPFVVNASERNYLQQQFVASVAQAEPGSAVAGPVSDPYYSHGSIDEMTDLADMPGRAAGVAAQADSREGASFVQSFTSLAIAPLERPPASSLT